MCVYKVKQRNDLVNAVSSRVITPGVTNESRWMLVCHIERDKAMALDYWNIASPEANTTFSSSMLFQIGNTAPPDLCALHT
jgi:hypothetical protein